MFKRSVPVDPQLEIAIRTKIYEMLTAFYDREYKTSDASSQNREQLLKWCTVNFLQFGFVDRWRVTETFYEMTLELEHLFGLVNNIDLIATRLEGLRINIITMYGVDIIKRLEAAYIDEFMELIEAEWLSKSAPLTFKTKRLLKKQLAVVRNNYFQMFAQFRCLWMLPFFNMIFTAKGAPHK
jgi:hypothetical protein